MSFFLFNNNYLVIIVMNNDDKVIFDDNNNTVNEVTQYECEVIIEVAEEIVLIAVMIGKSNFSQK